VAAGARDLHRLAAQRLERSRWIPQGLTYWPDRDALIIIYYDGDTQQPPGGHRIVASDSRGLLTA
jgi:hypothetical protein